MRSAISAIALTACLATEAPCPDGDWTTRGQPQCGYTARHVANMHKDECALLNTTGADECAFRQEYACANGTRLVQDVDPRAAWATLMIETSDGCVGWFEGELEVQ